MNSSYSVERLLRMASGLLFALVLLATLLVLFGKVLFASFYGNLGMVPFNRYLVRLYSGEEDPDGGLLRKSESLLKVGHQRDSTNPGVRRRLFEINLLSSDPLEAVALLPADAKFNVTGTWAELLVNRRVWPISHWSASQYAWWLGLTNLEQGEWEKAISYYQDGFALSRRSPPRPVRDNYYYALGKYDQSRALELKSADEHRKAGKYFMMAGYEEQAMIEAQAVLQSDENTSPENRAWAYQMLAAQSERANEPRRAIELYMRAVREGKCPHGLVSLHRLGVTLDDRAVVDFAEQQLAELLPKRRPWREYVPSDGKGARPCGDDWWLLGFDVDEDVLSAGLDATLVWYWQPTRSVEILAPDWYSVASRWLHFETIFNLTWNPGFESQLNETDQVLPGYSTDVSPGSFGLIEDPKGERSGRVRFLIAGDPENWSVQAKSLAIRTEGQQRYVGSGWTRTESSSDEQHAHLRIWWLDGNGSVQGVTNYAFARTDRDGDKWVYRGGLVTVPEGAEMLVLTLGNTVSPEGRGIAYFDDLLFVPVTCPPEQHRGAKNP